MRHRHLEAERRPYDDLSEGGRRALPRSFGSYSRQTEFRGAYFPRPRMEGHIRESEGAGVAELILLATPISLFVGWSHERH